MRISDWSSDVCSSDLALSHYTDWTIGHVHSGALGWNAFITFGALYYLVPVLWNRQRLYSIRLVSYHYWIATIGILLYITAMWVSGIMQGLMWRAYDAQGFLQYSFVETVMAMHRSEEHTSELQSLMRISYAVFCLKKKTIIIQQTDY